MTKILKQGGFSMLNKTLSVNIKVTLILCILAASTLFALQVRSEDSENKTSVNQQDTALIQVDSKYVCMINDQHFNKEQIPVIVDGKTYYGCCKMCEAKLKTDAKSRIAVDPVSGKIVDKALSVIGVTSDGRVFYFENERNLQKFNDSTDQ